MKYVKKHLISVVGKEVRVVVGRQSCAPEAYVEDNVMLRVVSGPLKVKNSTNLLCAHSRSTIKEESKEEEDENEEEKDEYE